MMQKQSEKSKEKKKKSTVRHTRAIQRDRSKRPTSAPPDSLIRNHMTEMIHPATLNQVAAFHALGLRERLLTLPVMMAFVLSLIWRQVGSVCEAVRVLNREGMLWTTPLHVTQQAVEQRLHAIPASLFLSIFREILPQMHQRWMARTRPLPFELAWIRRHFSALLAVDGSTLDVVLRKCGLLREGCGPALAGRIGVIIDLLTKLPHDLWYDSDPHMHDQRFWDRIMGTLSEGMLLIMDLGFVNYERFDALTDRGIGFITRVKTNAACQVQHVMYTDSQLREEIVVLGSGAGACRHHMRVVSVHYAGKWHRYVTNILDPKRLPASILVPLYWQRWRIEDAFNIVKRLLGLAYFWAGSINAIQVQVWATWIVYAVLVDLTDAVAEALHRPVADCSMEMIYRGLYHFTYAYHRGQATSVVTYLANDAKGLGILKRKRPSAKDDFLKHLTNHQFP